MEKNQWLTVKDLIDILNTMPQDAKVIIINDNMFENGCYYVTRDSIELYDGNSYGDEEDQVMIGTNHNTIALGWEV